MFFVSSLLSSSQAGRRRFESGLPLHPSNSVSSASLRPPFCTQSLVSTAIKKPGHISSSALPLIVRGLDRAGEGDDIRRENFNEKAIFAWSRPTLGVHVVVEHPQE